MSGIHSDGLPAKVLKHLAENGPIEREALSAFMLADNGKEQTGHVALGRLRGLGFIRTKVMLTPEGLAELKRIGWAPDMAGVAP